MATIRSLVADDAPASLRWPLAELNVYAAGFGGAEGEAVAAEGKFERVAQGGGTDEFDGLALDQAHFHQADGDGVIADDVDDGRCLAGGELIEGQHVGGFLVGGNAGGGEREEVFSHG